MQAQVAAYPATLESSFSVVGPWAEAMAQTALDRFEQAVQSVLDSPLDAGRVLEWTRLRAAASS